MILYFVLFFGQYEVILALDALILFLYIYLRYLPYIIHRIPYSQVGLYGVYRSIALPGFFVKFYLEAIELYLEIPVVGGVQRVTYLCQKRIRVGVSFFKKV